MSVPIAGQTVRVTTKRLGGGPSAREFYYAAESEPADAEALVKKVRGATPDEIVEAVSPLPQAAVDGLGLKRGEFTQA